MAKPEAVKMKSFVTFWDKELRQAITLAALCSAFLLSACSSPPRYAYVKEGASKHTTQSAMAKCDYQIKVQKTPPGEQAELKKLCMEGEGYRLKRVN